MRVSILLQITGDDGAIGPAEEVTAFEKAAERPEDLGLSIAEGKLMLAAVQARMVLAQAATWSKRRRCCPVCGERRRSKGSYPLVFRTLYGDIELDSPRLHRCPCQATDDPATVSPLCDLIPSHVAPERLYLEARWVSLVPYAAAAGLLACCRSPPARTGPPCASMPCVWPNGLRPGSGTKRRLFEVLKSQGLQANQDVTFLTDGGEEVRALTELVTPEAEHVLDWFHITMRLTVLSQYARGVVHHDKAEGARLLASVESIKWLLWHGNQYRTGEEIAFFEGDVDDLEVGYPNLGKFKRAAHEFAVYIASNADSLINYGERFRSGERISSCLAESTVNAVISKRFTKRQQMQWTKRGAHLLLQTRTRTLDGTLRPLFERWYPGLANDIGNEAAQATAA